MQFFYQSERIMKKIVLLFVFLLVDVNSVPFIDDFKILNDFRNGLENPELLKWPARGNDPCGPPAWPHVFCSNGRVTQIQVQSLGLKGPLPQNLNKLDQLQNLGLQRNQFNGKLPSFSGLSNLQLAYLDFNEFDTIPSDFFNGLSNICVLALDENPLNQSSGWTLPSDLAELTQLANFSCSGCNIVGPLPDFFGDFPSLSSLKLSYNKLTGDIPSKFGKSMLQVLWLNDQDGGGMTGSIDVIASMVGLSQVWLHGNQFSGSIPDNIGDLTSLRELNLNKNHLVGLIPQSLTNLSLEFLNLNNNMFMGPIPLFKSANVTFDSNSFCQSDPGKQCAPEVNALLDFLRDVNYPDRLASEWVGNDPCAGPWWGITCDAKNHVSIINLQKMGLNGTLSPSLVHLPFLSQVYLEGSNLHGIVPSGIKELRLLRLLNLSGNNFEPPLPRFHDGVIVVTDGNPKMKATIPIQSPSPSRHPKSPKIPSGDDQPSSNSPHSPNALKAEVNQNLKKSRVWIIVAVSAGSIFIILAILLAIFCISKRKKTKDASNGVVVHPKDLSDHGNNVKIAVVDNISAFEPQTSSEIWALNESNNAQVMESRNVVISLQVLRKVTNNFAPENEIGRGGFGVVYKGELEDGTKLAVKRMEAGAISNNALDEFRSEISVLSKVRHRHLVSLLGYSVEGRERLLVYEYLSRGALSRHLFGWKTLNLEPLSWARRLYIALDVARGVEYLHNLAHQSFIHRDLKSANILLDDDFRAKVSDFGLVKLAPDRNMSVVTRLAGTFGYLAPEYAVTGKITTKVDVFSFGVVLMELLTGLVALDDQRPDEKRYLVEWFWNIKSDKETLIASMDPALDANEEIHEKIYTIAELAGHCTSREPNHRPNMGHAVNVLSQLVDKWKPCEEANLHSGIDFTLPLPQMLKGWKEESKTHDFSGSSQDTEASIPAKPMGFADSFTSFDGR